MKKKCITIIFVLVLLLLASSCNRYIACPAYADHVEPIENKDTEAENKS